MGNWAYAIPRRRVKDARGFKVKVFDVLHKQTWWYSKTYSSLRNVKLAIAHNAFVDNRFYVRGGWNAETLSVDYRLCVELFIYDVETWRLAAIRRGNGSTDIVDLSEYGDNDSGVRDYWIRRAGEWEDNVKPQEEVK